MASVSLLVVLLLLLSSQSSETAQLPTIRLSASVTNPSSHMSFPTATIAGITVIDTPLVRAAQAYTRAHADDMTYNHVMRSWLFSVLISKKLEPAVGPVDAEVQALSAIMHDLGWDNTGELVSKDKRFEVDGAIAARNWIEAQLRNGAATDWDVHRVQLVWDAIALHTTPSIAQYKESVVSLVGAGIASDFQGPSSDPTGTLTWDEYNAVKKEFPRHNLGPGIRKIMCQFAETKPQTTMDNFQIEYGRRFVKNFNDGLHGRLGIDLIEASLPD